MFRLRVADVINNNPNFSIIFLVFGLNEASLNEKIQSVYCFLELKLGSG